MWLESKESLGSNFHFTITLQLEGARTRSSSRRLRSLTGLPILIVDDNASNRKILEEIITNWRMKPVLAQSGVEALAALSTKRTGRDRIALALLDVHMPDMDGFSLAERIRQDPLNRDLKLILLTSAGRPDDIARCEALDISGYLTKPVKQSELFDEIVTALAKKTSKHKTSENVDQAVTSPAAMRPCFSDGNRLAPPSAVQSHSSGVRRSPTSRSMSAAAASKRRSSPGAAKRVTPNAPQSMAVPSERRISAPAPEAK